MISFRRMNHSRDSDHRGSELDGGLAEGRAGLLRVER